MTTTEKFEITRLRELYSVDQERLALAKKRQAAVWRGKKPDKWPIVMATELTDEQEEMIPNPDFPEAFEDPEMMLCQQIRMAAKIANSNSDGVPSIRANMGTGTLLACIGLEQGVRPGQMPWLKNHLSREQVAALSIDDILIQGTFARALDFIGYFKDVMGDMVDIYCVDTQGPFDLAHLMLGDEVFYLIFEDPELLHHALELCCEIYIRATKATKEAIGEPQDSMVHGQLYVPNAGVRICEDTTTLIGDEGIEKFALPYTKRVASEFGTAWMHYCGRCDILRDILCRQQEVRGLNYGVVPSKESDFDFDEEMRILERHGKVYHGAIPRLPEENGKEYLERIYSYCKGGCLIPNGNPALGDANGFSTTEEALDFWYSLQ